MYEVIKDDEETGLFGSTVKHSVSGDKNDGGRLTASEGCGKFDCEIPTTTCTSASKPTPSPSSSEVQRLVSLDVFRGVTVVLMILVDDVGGIFPAISHSPWNGVTLADLVMPFFLFIVGVALALAYKRVPNKVAATKKASLRALKLFILGLVLQGGYFHGINNLTFGVDISRIRCMGILQRIAIAFFLVALCEIWLQCEVKVNSGLSLIRRYRFQLLAGSVITVLYLTLLYGTYVPDWNYQYFSSNGTNTKTISVKCGVRGDTGPGCNAVGFIDRKVFGIQHLYSKPSFARLKECSINSPNTGPLPTDAPSWCQAPFDPEGLLSSMMAVVTCLIGLQFGHGIVHFKDHKQRIINWAIQSASLLLIAFASKLLGMHMNKGLYTISYTCVTSGVAGLLFIGFYVLVDVHGFSHLTVLMEWIGKRALEIFVLVACNIIPILIQGFYWKDPRSNILTLIGIGSR